MQYTITAVSPQTRDYTTKFGDMRSYRVRFEGTPEPVEISQKVSTAPPQVGQTLEGTIDMSGQYGPKFKKEYNQGGFTGGTPSGSQSPTAVTPSSSQQYGSNRSQDPFTMYLSYAKDVAVALIGSKGGYSDETFAKILEDVMLGGKTLFDTRPGGTLGENRPKDNTPGDDMDPNAPLDMSAVDNMFPEAKQQKIDVGEIPF